MINLYDTVYYRSNILGIIVNIDDYSNRVEIQDEDDAIIVMSFDLLLEDCEILKDIGHALNVSYYVDF